MMSYRDRTYCSAFCILQGNCTDSMEYANTQKAKSTDPFIRDIIPIAVTDYSDICSKFIPKGHINESNNPK